MEFCLDLGNEESVIDQSTDIFADVFAERFNENDVFMHGKENGYDIVDEILNGTSPALYFPEKDPFFVPLSSSTNIDSLLSNETLEYTELDLPSKRLCIQADTISTTTLAFIENGISKGDFPLSISIEGNEMLIANISSEFANLDLLFHVFKSKLYFIDGNFKLPFTKKLKMWVR